MINFKILSKRIPTNEEGIFYKSIINENAKEVDKTYIIEYSQNIMIENNLYFLLIITILLQKYNNTKRTLLEIIILLF